ncbi:MAG TPA: hypothetical protein VFV68_04330 [Agriterribacter sp.]|nr:hypothetical protein [Agriterribacter sp.]
MKLPLVNTTLTVLLSGFVLMASCKKNELNVSTNDDYYIRFAFNGVQTEYTSQPFAGITTTNGMETMIIGAYKNFDVSSPLKEHISILIYNKTAIVPGGTYKDPVKVTAANGTLVPQVIITHYNSQETAFQTVGIFSDENGVVTGSDLIPSLKNIRIDATVNVTELTADYAKGTFSGTSYQADSWINAVHQPITNGSFFVKRQ